MPEIPTTFTHKLNPISQFNVDSSIDGGLDTNVSGGIEAKHSGSLETKINGLLQTDNVMKLKGDAKEPIYTDSKMEIMNLPRFTLQDIKDMMKVRMRIPNYTNVCFKVMGMELFSVCVSGEGQVITEPYIPNAAERCETDCCEPDTRPFPESQRQKISNVSSIPTNNKK